MTPFTILPSILPLLLLSSLTLAETPSTPPTDPSTTPTPNPALYLSSLQSYYLSLISDPSFAPALQSLEAVNPSVLSQLLAYQHTATHLSDITATPGFMSAVPTQFTGILESVEGRVKGIASSAGVLRDGKVVTGTATGTDGAGSTMATTAASGSGQGAATGSVQSENGAVGTGGGKGLVVAMVVVVVMGAIAVFL